MKDERKKMAKDAEEMEVTEAYDKTQKAVVSKALQANESRPTNGEKREKKREKKVKKKQKQQNIVRRSARRRLYRMTLPV